MGMGQARVGDMTSGHTSYQPIQLSQGSSDVFANGIPVVHQGQQQTPHPPIGTTSPEGPFTIPQGSQTVFINGQPQSRLMDMTSCGQSVIQGSNNVFIGD